LFIVDGDWTSCDPCNAPTISYPFKEDTLLSQNDIAVLDPAGSDEYVLQPVVASGYTDSYYNNQNLFRSQSCLIIEQDFMVAEAYYQALTLNTPYQLEWSVGWGLLPGGINYALLTDAILVEEGPLQDIGGGLVRLKRTFAIIPPSNNMPETYSYQFPGINYSGDATTGRQPFTWIVSSRIHREYFLYDPYGAAAGLGLAVWPDGNLLTADTGMNPDGLILQEQRYYANQDNAVADSFFMGQGDFLQDADPSVPSPGTNPSSIQYQLWVDGTSTSNGLPAEIVAETSVLEKWMGNIYCRKTRFVVAV
jgi:hypothetical protein